MSLDSSGKVYVANGSGQSVTIYAAVRNGAVAPIATISGSNTGLYYPNGSAVDSRGNIYVVNSGSVTVYAGGSKGDAAPIITISGSNTNLSTGTTGIALDSAGNIYVASAGFQYFSLKCLPYCGYWVESGVNVYLAAPTGMFRPSPVVALSVSCPPPLAVWQWIQARTNMFCSRGIPI